MPESPRVQAGALEQSPSRGSVAAAARQPQDGSAMHAEISPPLARPEIARSYGLSPMSFETWARQQRGMA
ncbi:hypothetical protein [Sorangium sp. So ce887]|uniref:hypothetical protein n=1 Tax=Sorangium sp. So ce887 TaxID=3133324 RepID=UPI003F629929